jgi:hypothetical protein
VTVPMLMAWYAFVIVVLLVVILTRRKRRKPFIVVDLRPLWTYEQIAETLRPEIRNAIEAAVAVPDPPPIELTRGEKLCIELQAECDHQMVSVWELGMPLSQCIWCGVDDFTPARSR